MACPSVSKLGSTQSSGSSGYIKGVFQESSSYTLGRREIVPEIDIEVINGMRGWCAAFVGRGRTISDDGMPRG